MQKLKFPDNFLWGAATSAHQVEGNTNNDWTVWEKANAKRLAEEARNYWQPWQKEKFPEMFDPENYISGRACDHYNRYEEDFDIAKSLGHNAHRFSIEWSRIEPEEGKFDEKEIEHYRKVIQALKQRGIEPFVTLWHWTLPIWIEKRGGYENKEFPYYFSRYVQFVTKNIGKEINFWITLNEPTAVIAMAYIRADWPPQKRNPFLVFRTFKILSKAHCLAYDEIHKLFPWSKVGFSHNIIFYEPDNKKNVLDNLIIKISEYFANTRFFNMTKKKHDFIGLQYYFHMRFKFPGIVKNKNKEISDIGWEIYPQGIYYVLQGLKKYNLPIYITENGLTDAKDEKREKFIKDHLFWVHKAIQEGVDVRGYFHWSLLDNFEWDKGFWPRFGLVEVDYSAKGGSLPDGWRGASGGKTLKRTIRPSAWEYKKIIEQGLS